MDFRLSHEQSTLRDSVIRFCEKNFDFSSFVARARLPSQVGRWSEFAELGWLGAGISEEQGGYGGGMIETAIVAEAFGKAMVSEPYIPTAVLALQTLLAAGGLRARELAGRIIAGELVCALAYCEPQAWQNPSHVSTRAVSPGHDFLLRGHKSVVVGAPDADLLLITARTHGEVTSRDGVSLFAVPSDVAGLRRQDYRLVDRRLASDVFLDDVTVGAEALVGRMDGSLPAVETGLDYAAVAACADSIGACEAAFWMTRDYIRTRHQFGQPLSNFQVLQHRMADMLVQLELARSVVYQGLAALEDDAAARARAVSATKVVVANATIFVGQQAIQLHGGIGMTEELAVGHLYKRLLVNASLYGGVDFHRDRFGSLS